MITPTAAEMLKSAERTFETVIKPDLHSTSTRSAAATIGHMLRIVALRIESEGQILHDESAKLGALLPHVAEWMRTQDLPVPSSLSAVPTRDPAIYPSLAVMAAEVGALRQGVCDALDMLQSHDLDSDGAALLQQLHEYVAWQLAQEGRMIDGATIGSGPRR